MDDREEHPPLHEPAHHAVPAVLIFCQRADDALLERTHAHSIPDITNPLAASNLIDLTVREPHVEVGDNSNILDLASNELDEVEADELVATMFLSRGDKKI